MGQISVRKKFAIKIYIGGINAVSGEPAVENMATKLRRQKLKSQGATLQDYVVTPQQRWLDGIATAPGQVRQFVAVSSGSGFSIEAQITGEDAVAGLQFEVTKRKRIDNKAIWIKYPGDKLTQVLVDLEFMHAKELLERIEKVIGVCVEQQVLFSKNRRITPSINSSLEGMDINEDDVLELRRKTKRKRGLDPVKVRGLDGEVFEIDWGYTHTVLHLKNLFEDETGIESNDQRMIWVGKQLDDDRTRRDYEIPPGSTIYVVPHLLGGGPGSSISENVTVEMAIAAGGLIKQFIQPDHYNPESWNPSSTTTFNVQILNAKLFQKITGKAPPKRQIDLETYFNQGFSFFDIPEAPSNIAGKFKGIQSIGQLASSIGSKFNLSKTGDSAEDAASTNMDSEDSDVSNDHSVHGQVDYSFMPHLYRNLAKGKPKMEFRTMRGIQDEVDRANIVSWT